jgi:Outer membrane protein beta-barrel domain
MRVVHASAGGFPTCLAATLLFATAAHAQGFEQPWRGLYLGGGGTYSTVSVEAGSACYDDDCWWGEYDYYEQGDGNVGWSAHAGVRLHDYVALEASYLETGSIRWEEDLVYMPEFNDYYNNRVDFSAQVTEVSLLGILPFADRWEVYLRLGAGFWDGTSSQRLDQSFGNDVVTRSIDDSGTGFLAGVGVGVTLGEAWHLRLDLQTVTIDEDVLNSDDDASIDSFLLELQYRIGAHRASIQPSAPPTATP